MCKIDGVPYRFRPSEPMSRTLSRRTFLLGCGACLLCSWSLAIARQSSNAQSSNPAPAQNQTEKSADTATPQPARSAAAAPVDSSSFQVGPGDILNIRVWHEEEFSGPVSVHQDGKITLPLVGDLAVGGMTPVHIEQIIAQALTKYVVKPLVTVTVQEVLSKKYYLDGQVARAGEYPLVTPTTILEAISKAGGLRDFANEKKIYVLRGDKRIPFNYKDVIHGKHMDQNIQLQPGDHVIVP